MPHHPLLLLALLPLGDMMWWAISRLRQIGATLRENDRLHADRLHRYPWLRFDHEDRDDGS